MCCVEANQTPKRRHHCITVLLAKSFSEQSASYAAASVRPPHYPLSLS